VAQGALLQPLWGGFGTPSSTVGKHYILVIDFTRPIVGARFFRRATQK